jgi:hypothetical protein
MKMSERCRWCGGRFVVAPGFDRKTERQHHEKECDLSVDCGYCEANVGERCHTASGRPSPPHSSRRLFL